MEKLTLRQFADVVKALVETGLSKENKKYNLKITETPNAGEDEGIRIVMTIKAEKEKEESAEQSYRSRKYSYSMTLNMNAKYHTYIMMLEDETPQAEVLKHISNDIVKRVLEENTCFDGESEEPCPQGENDKPKCDDDTEECRCSGCENDDEDLDEDWADEELDDLDCMRCKCIAKACLIFAAIPVSLLIAKNMFKKD